MPTDFRGGASGKSANPVGSSEPLPSIFPALTRDSRWLWRLPGAAPWAAEYVAALTGLIDGLGGEELAARKAVVPTDPPEFRYAAQAARADAFVRDLIAR